MIKDLLKMIEDVDPSDADAVADICVRVQFFLEGKPYSDDVFKLDAHVIENYCGARDALKAIRPDGWSFQMLGNSYSGEPTKFNDLQYYCNMTRDNPYMNINSPDLQTEELAELHAILKAIQWDRESDE